MAPRPKIPPQLKMRPFSLDEARAAGLSKTSLRGKSWRRLRHGLFCWSELEDDPWKFLCALARLLPSVSMFAGPTSAWLHRLPMEPLPPDEVIVPPECGWRSRGGLTVRHCDASADVVTVRGLRATSVHRTLADLQPRLRPVEALVLIDAALNLRLTNKRKLAADPRLSPLADLAEPAESPMETRLRWLLLEAGLPRPQVQTQLRDSNGNFVGRADLYYPSARLVIEYDGANHRERLVEDDRRQNSLLGAGFRLLRFTLADVDQRRDVVAVQVRRALSLGR